MYEYTVKNIIKIYDGDTITVELDLGFGVTKIEKIRLAGINTPEIRGVEREAGLISRDWLRERLYLAFETNQQLTISTIKDRKGKYGRYLGWVYMNDININEELIAEGLAIEYK